MTKRLIIRILAPLLGISILLMPVSASAWNPFGGVDCSQAGNSAVCSSQGNTDNPVAGKNGLIVKVTDFLAVIAGIAAVIVLIIAGFKYVTAEGDPKEVSSAKNTIIYALVGIVVIVAARALIEFVVSSI